MNGDPEFRARRDRLTAIVAGVVVVVLAGLIIAVGTFAILTRRSLCTFEGDLQSRADASRAILNAPDNLGRPTIVVYGLKIPRSTLANQLHGQDRTLKSLRGLHC